MPSRPEVTVVVPTRNRWDLLATTLAGALRQEDVDFEVVVVDDRSTDETTARLHAVADPRLRAFRLERDGGVSAARNKGIEEARGEWIAFLDDDDLWAPRKLRRQLDRAASAAASFVYAGVVIVDECRRATGAFPIPDPDDLLERLLARNVLAAGSSNVMARADLVRTLGGFDRRLDHLADWDLWIRLAAAGQATAHRRFLVGYVEHAGSMLLVDPRGVQAELDLMVRKHRPLGEALGVKFDRIAVSRWTAWGQLRAGRRLDAASLCLRGALAQGNPGNVLRAFGMLLGERAMARARRRLTAPPASELDWLSAYR